METNNGLENISELSDETKKLGLSDKYIDYSVLVYTVLASAVFLNGSICLKVVDTIVHVFRAQRKASINDFL